MQNTRGLKVNRVVRSIGSIGRLSMVDECIVRTRARPTNILWVISPYRCNDWRVIGYVIVDIATDPRGSITRKLR